MDKLLRRIEPWATVRLLLIAAVLVLAVLGMAFGVATTHDREALVTRSAYATQRSVAFELFACREAQFRALVPRGSRIFISDVSPLWTQRIAEFASGWALPVGSRQDAQYSIENAADGGACSGGLGFAVTPS